MAHCHKWQHGNTQLQAVILHASQPQTGLGVAVEVSLRASAVEKEEEGSALITCYLWVL